MLNAVYVVRPLKSRVVLTHALSVRSPSTPDLSADELPDDITTDIADIPNDLELNQEDFSDVLPRLPDDLQDFDLFAGDCTKTHTFIHTPFSLGQLSANVYITLEENKKKKSNQYYLGGDSCI